MRLLMTWFVDCRCKWRSLVTGPTPRPCPEDIRPKTAIDTPHRWPGHDGSGLPATVAWLLRRRKRCPRPPDVPRRPFPLRRSRWWVLPPGGGLTVV